MKSFLITFCVAAILMLGSTALAGVPQLINFQGQLKDNTGSPLINDTLAVEFKLYDDAVSGNVKWSEIDTVFTDGNGLFTILLGKNTPVPDSIFNDSLRWLGIKVGSDAEISPRSRMSTVGYSYVSSQWTSAAQNIFRLNGNVGIGTNSPLEKLHLQSIPSIGLILDNSGTVNRWTINVAASNNNALGFHFGGATKAYFQTDGDILFGITGGNVGIGTSSPLHPLHVADPTNGLFTGRFETGNTTAAIVEFNNSSSNATWELGVGGSSGSFVPAGSMYLHKQGVSSPLFVISPTGNVGIRTLPGASLHVRNPGFLATYGFFDTEGSNQYAGMLFGEAGLTKSTLQHNPFTNNLELYGESSSGIVIDSTGRVGIGTTSPTAKLEVAGTGYAIVGEASNSGAEDIAIQGRASGSTGEKIALHGTVTGSGGVGYGVLGSSTTGGENYGVYGSAFGGTTNWAGYFPSGNVFIFDNVGIGTTSPEQKLHVFKGSAGAVTADANSVGIFENSTHAFLSILAPSVSQRGVLFGDNISSVDGGIVYDGFNNRMDFRTNGNNNRMSITSTGSVGIGTDIPSAKLHVKGAGFPNSFGFFDTDAINQDAGLRFQEAGVVKSHLYYAASTNTLNLYGEGFSGISVSSTGSVGIGTTTPAALLHVNGTAGNNSGVWSTLSDRRLKKDIEPIQGALETVTQLQGVSFHWKDKDKDKDAQFGRVRGLIAQDVEKVIPEWIKTDPDGYKRIEPIGVDALLIEAIKEQQKQIEELQAEIAKLKTQPYQAQVED